jgi:hypothetical protein
MECSGSLRQISGHPQSDELAPLFIDCLTDLSPGNELFSSIQRLKTTMAAQTNDAREKLTGSELARSNSRGIVLEEFHRGELTAVQTAASPEMEESISR